MPAQAENQRPDRSGKPGRRFVSGLLPALILIGIVLWRRPPSDPPLIVTAGLDVAVSNEIERAVAELRVSQKEAAAWGKLGSVLIHYDFPVETGIVLDRAEKLARADARWPYLHALLLMPREPAAALPYLERAAALCGDSPDMPRLRLAQLYLEMGQTEAAEQSFRFLLERVPKHAPATLGMARLRLAAGDLQGAGQHLAQCSNDPHTAKAAAALMAQLQLKLGHTAAAEMAARQEATLPADQPWPDPYWHEASRYRVGRKALLQDASSLMDQGRLDDALAVLNSVTSTYADDDEGWYLTGWALNRVQRPIEAERALREHLRRSPDSPKGLSQLAVALLSQKRNADAVPVLEAALKLKPTWRELHFNLGYACLQLGRQDEAIRHLRDALAMDPNHVASHTALAELLQRRGEREEAGRLLRLALQLDPGNVRARKLLEGL